MWIKETTSKNLNRHGDDLNGVNLYRETSTSRDVFNLKNKKNIQYFYLVQDVIKSQAWVEEEALSFFSDYKMHNYC